MKFIALLLLLGAIVADPRYFLRVLDAFGAAKTITLVDENTSNFPVPLPVENISFQDIIYSPGQHNLGRLSVNLLPVRDPKYRVLQPYYRAINYEDIIEVSTSPDFVGSDLNYKAIVTRPKVGNLQQQSIEGVSILKKLENRRVQRYNHRTGTADAEIRALLKTYSIVFQDDFTDLSNWGATNWTVANHIASTTDALANGLNSSDTFSQAIWRDGHLSVDFNLPSSNTNSFNVFWASQGTIFHTLQYFTYLDPSGSTIANLQLISENAPSVTTLATRNYVIVPNTWYHLDVYTSIVSGTTNRRDIVVLNGIEMFDITDTTNDTDNSGQISFTAGQQIPPENITYSIANVVLEQNTAIFTAGDIDTTTTTFDQTFNGDTYLSVIEWYCNAMGWSYRVRPRAGFGNDLFDCGANIGRDFSSVLVVKEGDSQSKDDKQLALKILDLQPDQISEELATSLRVYGQSADDATSGFIANSLADFLTYGVIEKDYSDPRVTTSAIAKALGDARLLVTGAGNVSYSGTFLDESELLGQDPIWGSAVYGDFIWGGRKQLEAGDSFWLLSDTWGADKSARILGITRNSVDPTVQVVLDYFRWELDKAYQLLMGKFLELVRSSTSILNPGEVWDITQVGAGSQGRYVWFSPTRIASVSIDGVVQSGTGNVWINIDSIGETAVTAALGGPWSGDFHVVDTTYLIYPASSHLIEIRFAATKTLTMHAIPRALA